MLKTYLAAVGVLYFVFMLLGIFDVIDFKVCISAAGRCEQHIKPAAQESDK